MHTACSVIRSLRSANDVMPLYHMLLLTCFVCCVEQWIRSGLSHQSTRNAGTNYKRNSEPSRHLQQ